MWSKNRYREGGKEGVLVVLCTLCSILLPLLFLSPLWLVLRCHCQQCLLSSGPSCLAAAASVCTTLQPHSRVCKIDACVSADTSACQGSTFHTRWSVYVVTQRLTAALTHMHTLVLCVRARSQCQHQQCCSVDIVTGPLQQQQLWSVDGVFVGQTTFTSCCSLVGYCSAFLPVSLCPRAVCHVICLLTGVLCSDRCGLLCCGKLCVCLLGFVTQHRQGAIITLSSAPTVVQHLASLRFVCLRFPMLEPSKGIAVFCRW